jgi:hypothetical protein
MIRLNSSSGTLSPGLDYDEVFYAGLKNSSLKVVKFMLEQQLVPRTEEKLNKYLRMIRLHSEPIALLFSLGATDYQYIVERALIYGDLGLAEKYFDRAPGLKLNSIFKRCTSIPVYQYLISRGRIKQKTIDATLARLDLHLYVKAKQYLRSLSLHDGGSSSSSD